MRRWILAAFFVALAPTAALAQPCLPEDGCTGCPDQITKSEMATWAAHGGVGTVCNVNNSQTSSDCDPGETPGTAMARCLWTGTEWQAAGSGGITGPATTTNHSVVLWNATDGSAIKNSEIVSTDEDGDSLYDSITAPGGFVGGDRNAFSTPKFNVLAVLDNDVTLGTSATCANQVAGRLSLIDTDEASADTYTVCLGTVDAGELASEENNRIGKAATLPTCDATQENKTYIDMTGPGICHCQSSSWTLVGGTGPCT